MRIKWCIAWLIVIGVMESLLTGLASVMVHNTAVSMWFSWALLHVGVACFSAFMWALDVIRE